MQSQSLVENLYVTHKTKIKGAYTKKDKHVRRCSFHYVKQDKQILQRFTKWLKASKREHECTFNLGSLTLDKSFLLELTYPNFDLVDKF